MFGNLVQTIFKEKLIFILYSCEFTLIKKTQLKIENETVTSKIFLC